MTKTEIMKHVSDIEKLSHERMARLWRFAKAGHPYFNANHPSLCAAFRKRFHSFGGMTSKMSKLIG